MKTYQDVLPGQNYGLSEKTILSIYQDNDNQIWIGTDGGGINLFDPATGKFHHILSTWEEKVASWLSTLVRYSIINGMNTTATLRELP